MSDTATTTENVIVVEMTMTKETKNTYAFTAKDEASVIPTVYIKKAAFDGEPSAITLTLSV